MAVVATLDVILAAKTQQFNKDMQKEAGAVRKIKKEFEASSSGAVFKDGFSELAKSAPIVGGLASRLTSFAGSITSAGSAAGPVGMAIAGSFALATAGIVGAGAAVVSLKNQMNEIDDLADAATRIGVSFQELKTIRFSFGESIGLGGSEADGHIAKFQKSLIDASANSSDKLNAMFAMVGLNAGELLRRGPVKALDEISQKMKSLSEVDQMRLSFELFGKSGLEVVNALSEISEKSREIDSFLAERGLLLSESQVASVGAANDAWDRIALTVDSVVSLVAAEFAPVFSMVADAINESSVGLGDWTSSIRDVISGATYFAGVMYDAYEAVTVTYTTMNRIANLDFSGAAEGIKAAADFTSGKRWVENLEKERQDAMDAANEAKQKRNDAGRKASKFEGISDQAENEKEASRQAEADKKQKDRELKQIAEKRQKLLENFQLEKELSARTAGLSEKQARAVEDELRQQFRLKNEIAEAGFSGKKADQLLSEQMKIFKDGKQKEKEREDKQKLAEKATDIKKEFDPTFALRSQLAELESLRKKGLIDQSVFRKAAMDAAGKNQPEFKGAVSAQKGSVEAYKLIIEQENKSRQQEAIKQLAQKQLDVLNKIANSGGVIKVARN